VTDDPIEIPGHDRDLLARIGRLRARAWRTEAAFSGNADDWLDEYDATASHFAFMADGEPVAAARLTVHPSVRDIPRADIQNHAFPAEPPLPVAYLSRLVVDPAHRRKGLGARLDEARLTRARELGCGSVVSRPVDPRRVAQLERLGFAVVGRCKAIETGPVRVEGHPVMLMRLGAR
jgi:GNAT superfamily N-acetyltransferase